MKESESFPPSSLRCAPPPTLRALRKDLMATLETERAHVRSAGRDELLD